MSQSKKTQTPKIDPRVMPCQSAHQDMRLMLTAVT